MELVLLIVSFSCMIWGIYNYSELQKLEFKAEKTLVSATSTGNTIILTEEVKYKAGENLDLPNYLKSGTYRYTFRLDKNYNYVLISKTHETQY